MAAWWGTLSLSLLDQLSPQCPTETVWSMGRCEKAKGRTWTFLETGRFIKFFPQMSDLWQILNTVFHSRWKHVEILRFFCHSLIEAQPWGTVEESNSSSTSSLLFERCNLLSPQQCLCVGFTLSFVCDNLLSFLRVSAAITQSVFTAGNFCVWFLSLLVITRCRLLKPFM